MSNLRSLVAEAIGTALLVFLAVGAAVMAVAAKVGITGTSPGTTVTAAALAGGLVLLGILVSVGPMSRTHMSPAVTLALLRRRRMPVESAADAWIGQLLGAVAAGAGLFWFIPWLTQLDGTSARSVTAQASRTLVFQDVAIAAFLSVILLAAPLIGVGIAALIARPRRLVVNDAGPRSTERAAAAVATATVAEPSLPDNTVTPVHILAADGTPSPPPFAPAPWPAPRTPLPVPEPEPEAVIEPTPVVLVPEPVELVPEPVIEPTPVVVEPVVSAPEPVVEPVVSAPEPVVEPVIEATPAVVPVPLSAPELSPSSSRGEPVIEAERTLEPRPRGVGVRVGRARRRVVGPVASGLHSDRAHPRTCAPVPLDAAGDAGGESLPRSRGPGRPTTGRSRRGPRVRRAPRRAAAPGIRRPCTDVLRRWVRR
jgi:glycerol uptake facilitator-like aquaporin